MFSVSLFALTPVQQDISVIGIRVSFPADSSPGTTGDGRFLIQVPELICADYSIDPPPHDRSYFQSQLKALDTYFRDVSHNQFGLDLTQSSVYPQDDTTSYQLPNAMNYYHPYGVSDDDFDSLAVALFRDALEAANNDDPQIDFSHYDVVIVFHAGIGQDFSLPFLDPTPEDIPSTFVDQAMIQRYAGPNGIDIDGTSIMQGILAPETQNHLLFLDENDESLFSQTEEPCEYQFGLTGTLALMTGFAIGMPPLWDTESGESGIGVFGLMDQGSNNGRGMIPSPPDPWTRIYMGWELPQVIIPDSTVALPPRSENSVVKIPLTDDEYYLIEYRQNYVFNSVDLDSMRYTIYAQTDRYPPVVEVLFDSVAIVKDSNDVVIGIPNYDLGLPASGLLIWHIDEGKISEGLGHYSINKDRTWRGVDLVEADGAQDIGFPSIFLTADPSAGYFGDMWFRGNPEYERVNPGYENKSPVFGPHTIPDTRTNDGNDTYLQIDGISTPSDSMHFNISNTLLVTGYPDTSQSLKLVFDFDENEVEEVIYLKNDSLFWTQSDSGSPNHFLRDGIPTNASILVTNRDAAAQLGIVYTSSDSVHAMVYNYDATNGFIEGWRVSKSGTDSSFWVCGSVDSSEFTIYFGTDPQKIDSSGFDVILAEEFDPLKTVYTSVYYIINDSSTLIRAGIDDDGFIIVERDEQQYSTSDNRVYRYVAWTDLERDGRPDLLAITEDNTELVAYTSRLVLKSGFPVMTNFADGSPVLSANLIGDDKQELIWQTADGTIIIADDQGKIKFRLAHFKNSPLVEVYPYGNRNAVIAEGGIWQFDELNTEDAFSGWWHPHGDASHQRKIDIDATNTNWDNTPLLEKNKTYAYPNPVTEDKVTIRMQVGTVDQLDVMIYNIAGYFVQQLEISDPNLGEPNEIVWHTEHQEPGVYFAHVAASRDTQVETKVLKIAIIR